MAMNRRNILKGLGLAPFGAAKATAAASEALSSGLATPAAPLGYWGDADSSLGSGLSTTFVPRSSITRAYLKQLLMGSAPPQELTEAAKFRAMADARRFFDPDIAQYRWMSLGAKIAMQYDRNVKRELMQYGEKSASAKESEWFSNNGYLED